MKGKQAFPIAAAYCGAVVGAGFATGREVLEFFGVYGSRGVGGVLMAALLFMWAGVVILDVTHRNCVYSYLDLLRNLLHYKVLVFIGDLLFLGTLLTGVGVMAAAGGTILSKGGMGYPWACAIFLAICTLLLLKGSSGFVKANTWLVPGMILIIVGLCIAQISRPAAVVSFRPYGSSLLYVAYNTAIAAVALSTLKKHLSGKVVLWGGIGGGLLIGILLFMVYAATTGLNNVEIPMLQVAAVWLGRWRWLYELVLLGAVLTTALANMHGLASRIAWGDSYFGILVLIAGLGLIISQYGFARLVGLLYPLLGLCNIVLLVGLCYYSAKRIMFFLKSR